MADLEQVLNLTLDQFKTLATSKGMNFSSTATKPDFQILLLSKPSSDELVLVQSKLQLIESERTAQKEKLELERIACEGEVKQQTLLARIASDREAAKRDAFER